MTRRWGHQPNAVDVPFDPDSCDPPFISDNVQDVICEARNSAVGKLMYVTFFANGNTADKWLGYGNGSTESSSLPFVMPWGGDLIGATFSNQDDDVDIDMEVFQNGTAPGDKKYTWEIRNKRTAWKTDIMVNNFLQGDRISVFLNKFTGGSGDNTAQDPAILLIFSINPAQLGEGGEQNGD